MYAILDIESTGGKYNEEGITEIAIHRFDGHQVVDKFICLINPEREIQPFVAKLTGINNKMLRSAPKFHEVAKRIVEITEGTVLVAHNAQFDYRILRTEFRRLGYDFQRKTLCTVDLSKQLIPEAESHSLGKLARSLGIPMSDRHRANGDALATLKLFKLLLDKDSDKKIITEVIREETHGELSPNQLDMVFNLPSETGVYYMHDKDGEIIFLGKTKDIKKRVNQHFTNVGKIARKLQKETKKVTYETTGSELIAILKAYLEQKKNRPRYNHVSKKKLFTHTIDFSLNGTEHIVLDVEKDRTLEHKKMAFNGTEAAKSFLNKINEEFELCPSSLGQEVCMSEQNKGIAENCNEKVRAAFEKYSIQNKDIALTDRGRQTGERSFILIKNGRLQGFGFVDLNHQINNIHILESIMTPMKSDENTTFIVEAYLRKNNRLKTIPLTR
ncbi:exonuclease domain-containing protein [Allomuricauda sp.]|jgi:DNA polymerase-3 subunit epsilon|uniref:exonuclease domain-containing protein n=1 Tax=Flagellimonas sp. TaxID=2058762 RepID=UPI001B1A3DC0|nr:exonuclease domain-containing protein [Allomuricauda sp.]MBO6532162.1 ribonuclease H-like domain-containing protein [Allomuricauda sp.]MBO6589106.1 ribonuclease H-like domain-containing protein [Allomuricauda sp.]MBO6618731.1 ribonuclease H-like domain-containing protein [Allomuricauda sp.]MBO6644644.1 ribonuclease H-like domain-containing protein [Allomuricauda sp.]MBO6746544.1 ribonuclease H-like domain-containing protein [Allomuricauda sp.]